MDPKLSCMYCELWHNWNLWQCDSTPDPDLTPCVPVSNTHETCNRTSLLRPLKGLSAGGLNIEVVLIERIRDFGQHVVKYNKSQQFSSLLINTLCNNNLIVIVIYLYCAWALDTPGSCSHQTRPLAASGSWPEHWRWSWINNGIHNYDHY